MTVGAGAAVDPHRAFQRLVVAAGHRVDREHDGGTAGVLGTAHERLGHGPVVGRMELLPQRRASAASSTGTEAPVDSIIAIERDRATRAVASSAPGWKARWLETADR